MSATGHKLNPKTMILKLLPRSIFEILRPTPMHKVFKHMKEKGISTHTLNALEIFGFTGEFHTIDYFKKVASLDVWEIEEKYKTELKKNLPGANIKITDSFYEMIETNKKYNLIIADNPMSNFSAYCEHFQLFPGIFRLVEDYAIIILNVIPYVDKYHREKYPYLFNDIQLEARARFYNTNNSDNISLKDMAKQYRNLAILNNMRFDWYFTYKRSIVYYFVFKVTKNG